MSTATVYTNWALKAGQKAESLSADSLKLALFGAGYTPNRDTDTTYAGISANEVANGSGYLTGGQALANAAWAADAANHRARLTASDVVWNVTGVISYRYAVLYDVTTGDLIALYDPGATQTGPSSGTLTVQWDAVNGVLTLTCT